MERHRNGRVVTERTEVTLKILAKHNLQRPQSKCTSLGDPLLNFGEKLSKKPKNPKIAFLALYPLSAAGAP